MSERYDMIIIGAGISGLAMALKAQQAGLRVRVLEKSKRCGGCLQSQQVEAGKQDFWLEMGTHTCFNSYTRLLQILHQLDMTREMRERSKLRYRLLTDGQLLSIPSRLHWLELLSHVWRLFSLKKDGQSIAAYYSALVGKKNYAEIFRHAFNAVTCQPADQMPADMLFRKRPRDTSIMRSYTFDHGLEQIITNMVQQLDVQTDQDIRSIEAEADGYSIRIGDESVWCDKLICATPVLAASRLLQTAHPDIAEQLSWVQEVEIESVAVVVAKDKLPLQPVAGIIAVDGDFYSAVSRDVVGHPALRGLTFHFKPGLLSLEQMQQRICRVLAIDADNILHLFHKTNRLPAPDMGHHQLISNLDNTLAGKPLGLVGNYFNGVAVEDCLERVDAEFTRLVTA